jgi:hypothetical protein
MSREDASQAAVLIIFGGWLAVHCSRAALRECRSGMAQGMGRPVSRKSRPVHFWTIILVDWLAAALGVATFASGLILLITGSR